MGRLDELKAAKTRSDLAKLLHFTPKGLAYVLYKTPAADKYSIFTIPKKGGGERRIEAPEPRLKLLQTQLAAVLYDCLEEIESETPNRRSISHGYHRGRSIVTNAVPHRRHRYVLNIDLSDFFGTINFGRVRGFFIKDSNFALTDEAATTIAQIACHEGRLPQGSPCSPVISNLIARILDVRLARLAKSTGCTYTRYVDDLTFSTAQRTFPPKLAKKIATSPHKWRLMRSLRDEIKNAGFKINTAKTRMQICGSRQEATGLVINEKINISQPAYRTIRSMTHTLFSTGKYFVPGGELDPSGAPKWISELAPLEGRLAHLYFVKARRDRSEQLNKRENFKTPRAVKELYRRFLFYKYCVAPEAPLIVTEGKTDVMYLKSALKARGALHPQLASEEKGKSKRQIRFLPASYMNNTVLELGSSASQLTKLIESYSNRLKLYRHRPPTEGVVQQLP